MIEIRKIKSEDPFYPYIENLLISAFPIQERRDSKDQRELTNSSPIFNNNVVIVDRNPIGVITYWDMEYFYYIEHFAIDEKYRNKGYGQKVLSTLKRILKAPIILEAEVPSDKISSRRINFYQRQGFILHDLPYLQPPYREGDLWFPLMLMSYGEIDMINQYETIKNKIYKHVYRQ